LQADDIYCIPRRVVHQFQTVSGCISVTWHLKYAKYYQEEKDKTKGLFCLFFVCVIIIADCGPTFTEPEIPDIAQSSTSRGSSPGPIQRKRPQKKANSPQPDINRKETPPKNATTITTTTSSSTAASPLNTAPTTPTNHATPPASAPPVSQVTAETKQASTPPISVTSEMPLPSLVPSVPDTVVPATGEEAQKNMDDTTQQKLVISLKIAIEQPQAPVSKPDSTDKVNEGSQKPAKKPKKHWDDEDEEDVASSIKIHKTTTSQKNKND
jgi:hypothetical protein